jgi:hypothetical protein
VTDFTWDAASGRYRGAQGRYVSQATVRDAVDDVLDAATARMQALARRLQAGTLDLATWQRDMAAEIKASHLAAAMVAHGGKPAMSKSDYGWTGRRIRTEYDYLRNFARQVASGEQPLTDQIVARAALYGQAGRATYEGMRERDALGRGEDEERNVLGPADHCTDCVGASAQEWGPPGTLVPIGRRQCKVNCHCRIERRASGLLDPAVPADDERPARRGEISDDLNDLSEASRALWTDAAERTRAIQEILDADAAGDGARLNSAFARIDAAVTEALRLLDLPRGRIGQLIPSASQSIAGRKIPECDLEIGMPTMRAISGSDRGSDTTFRTWVHESIHARHPYADGHLSEYRVWIGYEEGLAEGLARIVVRGRAGLDPFQPTYNFHVAVYETLAEAAGVDYEDLLRLLWRQPAGRVRAGLVDAIDEGRRARSLPALTDDQRDKLMVAADRQFMSENSVREPSRQVMLILWRSVFR